MVTSILPMVLLKVAVVDGTLGELSPQRVIEWARDTQDLLLTEVQLDFQEWTFKAKEQKDGAIRTHS